MTDYKKPAVTPLGHVADLTLSGHGKFGNGSVEYEGDLRPPR